MARRKQFNCHGTAKLCHATNKITHGNAHSHTTDAEPVVVERIMAKVRSEVANNKKETVKETFTRITRDDPVGQKIKLPKYQEGLFKRKRTGMPKIPKTIQEMIDSLEAEDQPNESLKTYYTRTVHLPSGEVAGCMFSHPSLVRGFELSEIISYDGMFYTCPRLFKQNFIVMFEAHGHFYPGFINLMTGFSEQHYLAVFRAILELAPNFQGKLVMGDFEKASRKAAQATLGNELDYKGCFFHVDNCIQKHIRLCGLMKQFMKRPDFHDWVCLVMALPLLPSENIIPAWDELKTAEFNFNPTDQRNFKKFVSYFQCTWIGNVRRDGTRVGGVPVEVLSVFGLRHATNNHQESFNGRMKGKIVYKNPGAWRFILALNEILVDKANDYENMENDPSSDIVRNSASVADKNIKQRRLAEQKLTNGEYTAMEFLKKVRYSFKSSVEQMQRDYRIAQLQERVRDPNLNESFDSESENEPEGPNCIVCLLPRTENWALIPCGHQEFCHNCVQRLREEDRGCPTCRAPIQGELRTFGAAV